MTMGSGLPQGFWLPAQERNDVPVYSGAEWVPKSPTQYAALLNALTDPWTNYLYLPGRAAAQQNLVKGFTVSTYERVGSNTAPANVTAGDLTAETLWLPDQASSSLTGLINGYSNGASVPFVARMDSSSSPTPAFRAQGAAVAPRFQGVRSAGTVASPTGVTNGLNLANFVGDGFYDTSHISGSSNNAAVLGFLATETWSSTAQGTSAYLSLTTNGSNAAGQAAFWTPAGFGATGYIAAGFTSAPTNVTAGDGTFLRAHIGTDAAFTSGMGFETNAIQSKFGGAKTLTASLDAMVTVNPTLTNNTSAFISGLNVSPTLNGSGDSAAGMVVRPLIQPSANITDAYGASLAAIGNIPNGVTVTNLIGFRGALATLSGTGAITNAVSIKAEGAFTVAGGPTPTNNISLEITAASGGTNNYDIKFGTVDATGGAGAYAHRIPVLVNGVKEYLRTYVS